MSDDKERIRQRAYQIWLEEGRPEGREAVHWDMARELVAIEDAQKATAKKAARSLAQPMASDRKKTPAPKRTGPTSPRPGGKRK